MGTAQRPAIALALALALPACTVTVRMDEVDVDRVLGQMDVRAVVRAEGYTLWSCYDLAGARLWSSALDEEFSALGEAFGDGDTARHAQVRLRALEGIGPRVAQTDDGHVTVERREGPDPKRGLRGWANEDGVSLFVPATSWLTRPDGERVASVHAPQGELRHVLRHELAHWWGYGLDFELPDWLDEGLTQCVEELVLERGRLVDRDAAPAALERARSSGASGLSLTELLDWRDESIEIVEAVQQRDDAGLDRIRLAPRAASGLYVRFRLGLTGDGQPVGDLARRVRALAELPRAEHRAEEARWRTWLDETLDRGAPTPPAR